MSLTCAQCSRINPAEAAYCYYDGAALAGRSGGPVNAGSAPFPNQFVFPNGTQCRNFDQLALACQQHWAAAIDLLKQGYLGSFFGGLGRVDLAMAAQEAAKFPDIERGLDQLLEKLPTQALQAPKLQAEPSEINLGQLKIGQDRATELHLTNLGMRLLYGNVVSDCKWLTIGETPGHSEKIIQFGNDSIIPIHVRGQHLRAGTKPLEGHLVIDSNGGTATVTVKADVPITPYSGGLFDGATTPRQVAEKAKATPKEAAPFFEGGAVAKWYASNGWAYPVQGPTMSGMGAIQQFFEALGVAKPPKVDFSLRAIDLQGGVGHILQTNIDVTTAERKVVYGWATCDQSWVEVGRTRLTGKVASIPITVRIPSPAPPVLEAKLHVTGNGNQKIVVPLRVNVAGGKKGIVLQEEVVALEVVEDPPMVLGASPSPRKTPMPPPSAYTPAPPAPSYTPMPAVEQPLVEENPFAVTEAPVSRPGAPAPAVVSPAAPRSGLPTPLRLFLMFLPIPILGTCLLGLIARDIFFAPGAVTTVDGDVVTDDFADAGKIDPHPRIKVVFDEMTPQKKGDKDYADTMMFAVHKINPDDKTEAPVKLNYYDNGLGNSVVANIDGKPNTLGKQGTWLGPAKDYGKFKQADGSPGGKTRTFDFQNGIQVTQSVAIVPGDPVLVKGVYERQLNVCLARYKIYNKSTKSHKVGLRVLLDTCIGNNDGAPFLLPGEKELVATSKEFKGKDVPDFVQVLEHPDLNKPGTVVQLNLRISDKLEMPYRFLLTRYPVTVTNDKKSLDKWDIPLVPMGDDSSVAMFWEERELKPKESRQVAFAYGLGSLTAMSGGKLGVTIGGGMYVGGEITIVAMVADPNAKKATLKLPPGLKLIDPDSQEVPPSRKDAKGETRPVPVAWRVRVLESGNHDVTVSTDTGLTITRRVTITAKSLFN